jgi:hypothetical protein
VRLEASTKPPIHNLIHEFFINMVFTMICPNFKKGLEMAFGPLGVNMLKNTIQVEISFKRIWINIHVKFIVYDQIPIK